MKLSKDSQVIDSDYEETPTFSAWASLRIASIPGRVFAFITVRRTTRLGHPLLLLCLSRLTLFPQTHNLQYSMTLQVRDGATLATCHTSSLVLCIHGNPAPHTMLTALHCIKISYQFHGEQPIPSFSKVKHSLDDITE